jgi:hypothetical protein
MSFILLLRTEIKQKVRLPEFTLGFSKTNREHNGQTKYKTTNNDLQNMHIKLKIE